jgi:hypothetical protein
MGFDIERIIGDNKNHLKCFICYDVFKDVVEINRCQHLFCTQCIDSWFKHNHNTCPVDRIQISRSQLRRPPRIITDLLSQLRIKCEFETYGCEIVCQLSQISQHEKTCNYRSDTMALCQNGCGLQASRYDLKQHSCIKFLREKIELQDQKISALQNEIKNLKSQNHSSIKRKKPKRK